MSFLKLRSLVFDENLKWNILKINVENDVQITDILQHSPINNHDLKSKKKNSKIKFEIIFKINFHLIFQ